MSHICWPHGHVTLVGIMSIAQVHVIQPHAHVLPAFILLILSHSSVSYMVCPRVMSLSHMGGCFIHMVVYNCYTIWTFPYGLVVLFLHFFYFCFANCFALVPDLFCACLSLYRGVWNVDFVYDRNLTITINYL